MANGRDSVHFAAYNSETCAHVGGEEQWRLAGRRENATPPVSEPLPRARL